MKKKEYKYVTLWTKGEDDDILFASYLPKLHIDINIARELVENRLDFSANTPHFVVIDFSNVGTTTKDARDFMNAPEGGLNCVLAAAFISKSVVSTFFVNLFLSIYKPDIPARFFNKKEGAVAWCRDLRKQQQVTHS